MQQKKIVILGSTGSIGVNTLKVIKHYPDRFKVVGLTAYSNCKLLEKQIKDFVPQYVAVNDKGCDYLKSCIDEKSTKILNVCSDLEMLVSLEDVDIVVIGMRGSAALGPFLKAAECGKIIAPANKEALVVAGKLIMDVARKNGATIIPVDSEQSAIFQCLQGQRKEDVSKIILTASGGTLRNISSDEFDNLSVSEILKHPTWKMGKKITVDSAMLMNKGFEVIEAMRLFDLSIEEIDVIIHPESMIHSMVEFKDGSVMAQIAPTDMRLPIQYALTYPERWDTFVKPVNFIELQTLTFEKPDMEKFPSLALCFYVAKQDGTLPSVLNAADEEAVEAFLNKKMSFTDIYKVVEKIVMQHHVIKHPNLNQILEADQWARKETRKVIETLC